MRETRFTTVDGRRFPVLISDEKEALQAANAAGRAIVGLWDGKSGMENLRSAMFVLERLEDADEWFLERVVRRKLGLPWPICETKRLLIREMAQDDLQTVWENRVGRGFSTIEGLKAYTKHQYEFFGFGFWALERKEDKALIGVAGVTTPRESGRMERFVLECSGGGTQELELGYHVFAPYRGRGYAGEACRAILRFASEELSVGRFCAVIAKDNEASRRVAESLGFTRQEDAE